MRFSEIFTKTQRTPPKDEESLNSVLLERAGFIQKLMAGVYILLPLGNMVLNKIENIVREEINKAGGEEILMPALHPKENWERTGRWDTFDALFKMKSRHGGEYALGPTHEEILFWLLKRHIYSYRDLPRFVYQIQTKFRDELRAKSGMMRLKEFRMKDLYSFHANDADRDIYYKKMAEIYIKIFSRLGLQAIPTRASGGTFSEESLEFQVVVKSGEDAILLCSKCNFAVNEEVADGTSAQCPKCGKGMLREKAVEVGNIFPLKDKYAKDFDLTFKNEKGEDRLVSTGCYGLGTSRAMGAIAEIYNDEKGLIWPHEVAPFRAHLIDFSSKTKADEIYRNLLSANVEILYDNRDEASSGEKFADADLMGMPLRIVVSSKTLSADSVEVKKRRETSTELVKISNLINYVK